ncbi:MAG: porin [Zoogloeaceae bacterium]|jgi:predicted porin|nr:porin [Zoogloeaceae bacterium]
MQKKLIALAVAGLVSGAAFAQSNVTIYGIADVAYGYVQADDVKSIHAIESGGLSPSRIGFKGVEDLGNGVSALFVLEYGLMMDRGGSAQAEFGFEPAAGIGVARQQLVGLTGGFGTVVAGHAQTAGYDFACATSAYTGGLMDAYRNASVGTLLSCTNFGRAGNAFAYISPSFGGLTIAYNHARVTEGIIGSTMDINDSSANLIAVKYANGPIAAQAVYSKVTLDKTAADLGVGDLKEWGINGSYDFNIAKVYASYQESDLTKLDGKNKQWGISASFPIGGTAGAIHAGYTEGKFNDGMAKTGKLKAYTIAYTHGLSKRTTAYAGYTHLKNNDQMDRGVTLPSKGGALGLADGAKSSIFGVGLRHSF